MQSAPFHPGRWPHAKALWGLAWRMTVLTPIVGVLGILVFALVLGLSILPPFLIVALVMSAKYLWAIVTVALWFVWLRFGRRVRHLAFEGFEHASL